MATAYERVRIARGAKRPTGMDYLQNVFHGFFELHGDRRYADDPGHRRRPGLARRGTGDGTRHRKGTIRQKNASNAASARRSPRATARRCA